MQFFGAVTAYGVICFDRLQRRDLRFALSGRVSAARMKGAARRRVRGICYFTLQQQRRLALRRVCYGRCGHERLARGMARLTKQGIYRCFFNNFTHVHNGDAVGYMANYAQIVRDK